MLNIKSCVFYSALSNVTRFEFFLAAGKYGARFFGWTQPNGCVIGESQFPR